VSSLFPFADILPLIIVNLWSVLWDPVFWIVVLLIGLQYWRMNGLRESIYGIPFKASNWGEVGTVVLMGLLGGLLGSLLMVFIGVTLSGSGLMYIWPLAILLMLVDARFICFAYAGGAIALSSLLLGFPQINVAQLLALVAVLHMVESMLIFFSGHLGAVPAFFRDRTGRVVGGFTLQKFWPIPITALALLVGVELPPGSVDMPEWWPLISNGREDADNIAYTLMPVVAALGYGDMALTRSPRQKGWLSAGYLALYSLLLLILAVLAENSVLLGVLAALFAPLGHETVIYIGRRVEMQGQPIHVPQAGGLAVLDVVPESPAWQAGLRSGDLLEQVNGLPVRSRADLAVLLADLDRPRELAYVNRQGRRLQRELRVPNLNEPLGILPVPEGSEQEGVIELRTTGFLTRWVTALGRRLGIKR